MTTVYISHEQYTNFRMANVMLWCTENLQEGGYWDVNWMSDDKGKKYAVKFSNPQDATLFMLKWL